MASASRNEPPATADMIDGVSRYQVATLNITISMWPANMLAHSRTARVNGRRITFEKNSSRTISGTRGLGSPSSQTRFLTPPLNPCVLNVRNMYVTYTSAASTTGYAKREVAGNCASGMIDITFMIHTKKKIDVRKGTYLLPFLPITS